MRPINLVMQAFEAYPERVEISFDELGANNLFLICGATGSGKTAIFDAVCFALFNCSSTQLRTNTDLRSHFAKNDTECFVDFSFLYNSKVYRIIRKPPYLRKKLKGEGEILTKPSVELYLPDGKIISNLSDADNYIVELLGVNAQQFSRIALLAQGDFLKLLNASTQERGDIFRTIFKTSFYSTFQNKLKDDSLSCKDEYERLNSSLLQYISQLDIIDDNLKITAENYKKNECFDNFDNFLSLLKDQNKNDAQSLSQLKIELSNIDSTLISKRAKLDKISAKQKLILSKNTLANEIKSAESLFKSAKKEFGKISSLNNEIELLKQKRNVLNEDYKKFIELSESIKKLDFAQNELNNMILEFDKMVSDLCELKLNHLKNILFDIIKQTEKLETLKADYIEFENLLKKQKTEFNEKYHMYFSMQAGILAADLADDTPCPVCGSTYHPNPAIKSDSDITKESLDNLKETIDKNNLILAKKSQECAKLSALTENLKKNLSLFKISYKIDSDIDIKDFTPQNSDFETLISVCTKNIADFQDNISTKRVEIASVKAIVDSISKNLKNKDENEILSMYEKLNKDISQKETASQEIIDNYNNCNIALNKLLSNLELLKTQLKDYSKIKTDDFDVLNKEIFELSNEYQSLSEKCRILYSRYSQNEKLYNQIVKTNNNFNKIQTLYLDYKTLSDCANGMLKGKKRITFEQYIQAYYLDMVLYEANKRFKVMTNGQFQLLRKSDTTSLNTKTGLDIEVMDFYTYKTRSTKTLSGGESFKAALCLALGLSDCVSQLSGALNIDSMFIDEGFGTLDSDSLEIALDVIFDLSSCDKLIGIISHVDELKSKITNQIITHKTDNGSYVTVSV